MLVLCVVCKNGPKGRNEEMVCACGVRSPYSSVVEHPLSKRKVGSSILPGGIDICRPRIDEVVCFLSCSHVVPSICLLPFVIILSQ